MEQVYIVISGHVQGVGFRQFIKHEAQRRSVTGWARNTTEGAVEVVLQGKIEDLKEMVLLCRKGPLLAEIKEVEVLWNPDMFENESYTAFDLLPTI